MMVGDCLWVGMSVSFRGSPRLSRRSCRWRGRPSSAGLEDCDRRRKTGRHVVLLCWGQGEHRPESDSARLMAATIKDMGPPPKIARCARRTTIAQRQMATITRVYRFQKTAESFKIDSRSTARMLGPTGPETTHIPRTDLISWLRHSSQGQSLPNFSSGDA